MAPGRQTERSRTVRPSDMIGFEQNGITDKGVKPRYAAQKDDLQ